MKLSSLDVKKIMSKSRDQSRQYVKVIKKTLIGQSDGDTWRAVLLPQTLHIRIIYNIILLKRWATALGLVTWGPKFLKKLYSTFKSFTAISTCDISPQKVIS